MPKKSVPSPSKKSKQPTQQEPSPKTLPVGDVGAESVVSEPVRTYPRLATTCAATVKAKPLRFLVPGVFPLGKLVLLAGDGGLGKSTITLDLVARLTLKQCAFAQQYEALEGEVLIASCEDDPEDTIVPRLMAAGADLQRIHFITGLVGDQGEGVSLWSLANYEALQSELEANPAVKLVIVDPASAFAGRAGIDGHKDTELRSILGPLSDLAAKYAVTILLVAHIGKADASKAVRRVLGSVAWVNAVRAAWIVAEGEGEQRLFLPIKSNLTARRLGLRYSLVPLSEPEEAAVLMQCDHLEADDLEALRQQLYRVEWLGETDAEADQVFADANRRPERESDTARAAAWLRERLANGAVESKVCVDEGNAALKLKKPLKWWRDTVLKGELQGKPQKDGFNGPWLWVLLDSSPSWDSSNRPFSTPDSSEPSDSSYSLDSSDSSVINFEEYQESQEYEESQDYQEYEETEGM